MPVTDSIQSIRSAAFAFRKARVVIRDNIAHVFVNPSGPPTQTFTITKPTTSLTYATAEFGPVHYRPVGSSCQWALAKCKVSTDQLLARIPAPDPSFVPEDIVLTSVTPEPITEPPATLSDAKLEPIDPATGTPIAEIEELSESELEALTAPDQS